MLPCKLLYLKMTHNKSLLISRTDTEKSKYNHTRVSVLVSQPEWQYQLYERVNVMFSNVHFKSTINFL